MEMQQGLRPSVSVVIVNYNTGGYLADCVQTVLPQVQEVIVVDNASGDESVALCAQRFSGNPALQIIRNADNLGFAAGCNIGARRAGGETLLFLNPDCFVEQDAVLHLSRVLDSSPDIGMVGGLLLNSDGTEQGGGRRAIPTPWRSFVRAFGLTRFSSRWPELFFDFHLHKQPLPPQAIDVEAISGACMLVKRAAIDAVGLWDEGYFLHCEDLDWCMRFRNKGWRVLFVPQARVTHAHRVSSRSRPIFVEWHKHKGMMRFYRKFFGDGYSWPMMGFVAAGVWTRFGLLCIYHLLRRGIAAVKARHG